MAVVLKKRCVSSDEHCQAATVSYLESMQRLRDTRAKSPPGTRAGGSLQIPSFAAQLASAAHTEDARYLESSGAPVDELDRAFGLDNTDCGVHILGYHVTAVKQAAGHCVAVRTRAKRKG